MRIAYVSPSDLAYLSDVCGRCWWRKINKIQSPKTAYPKIFGEIDRAMKRTVNVDVLRSFDLPVSRVVRPDMQTINFYDEAKDDYWSEQKLRSAPIVYDDLGATLIISGYLDQMAVLEDDTILVTDFKASEQNEDKMRKFERQVHGYQYCLENPAKGEPKEVTMLGICWYTPKKFDIQGHEASLTGQLTYTPVEIDRPKFQGYLRKLAAMVGMTEAPPAGTTCEYCECVRHAASFDRSRQALADKQRENVPV